MKPGFKQTEVGVIPEDWEVKSIRELGQLSKGKGIRKNEADSGSIPCIRYGELYTHHNDVIRLYNSRISEQVAKTSRRLNKGDILFAGSGETKEEIGKCAAFIGDEIAYAGGDILVLTPNQGDPRYFGYLFNAPAIARQKAGKGQGDAIVHITAPALSSVRVPLPPTVAEQEAIASALGDADALIESLERLIAKKRDVKQGAMQELLTARRRLPGVTGEWETKRLGEICDICKGELITEKNCIPGEIPVIAGGRQPAYFHKSANRRGKTITVSASGASAGYVALYTAPIYASDCSTISECDSYSLEFVYYALLLNQNTIYNAQSGGAQPHIHPDDLVPLVIAVPNTKDEQTAIAAVLSDMDAELAALEAKLAKARAIKQGMMQELLTGRIRLK